MKFRFLQVGFLSLLAIAALTNAAAATVPTGFTDAVVAGGLNNPTAMALAPGLHDFHFNGCMDRCVH